MGKKNKRSQPNQQAKPQGKQSVNQAGSPEKTEVTAPAVSAGPAQPLPMGALDDYVSMQGDEIVQVEQVSASQTASPTTSQSSQAGIVGDAEIQQIPAVIPDSIGLDSDDSIIDVDLTSQRTQQVDGISFSAVEPPAVVQAHQEDHAGALVMYTGAADSAGIESIITEEGWVIIHPDASYNYNDEPEQAAHDRTAGTAVNGRVARGAGTDSYGNNTSITSDDIRDAAWWAAQRTAEFIRDTAAPAAAHGLTIAGGAAVSAASATVEFLRPVARAATRELAHQTLRSLKDAEPEANGDTASKLSIG